MTFIDRMEALAKDLSTLGYSVVTPVRESEAIDWDALSDQERVSLKKSYIDGHLCNVRASDIVLIANYTKNGTEGYIGANTLMELSFAYALSISVAYLFPVGDQPCKLETEAVSRFVVGEDLSTINKLGRKRL